MTDAAVEKAEIEEAKKEKEASAKKEKLMEEEMKKVAEEEKKIEDPKVAKRLEAEDNEFGEKLVSSA